MSVPVTAELTDPLRRVVSDGIVAPGYEPGAVGVLAAKKGGGYLALEADPAFEPPGEEVRELHGLRLVQRRDDAPVPEGLSADLRLALIAQRRARDRDGTRARRRPVRYTQSNSVALVRDGATLGVGAGQQSRVDCIRLAREKARLWRRRRFATVGDEPSAQDRVTAAPRGGRGGRYRRA
ncbi:hypothetical protein [Dactylosporangium sp. CA-233914]|uniref:hypothetical protein n=1 Tax=Dactylosporangium sp. CA-233914 TaxID=3239934 RepID=UPI003D8BA1A4